MSRNITQANLEAICNHLNKTLASAKTPYRYTTGGAYGRTYVYKGTIEKFSSGEYVGQHECVYAGTKSECYEILHAIFRGANEVLRAKESRAIVKRQKANEKARNRAIKAQERERKQKADMEEKA